MNSWKPVRAEDGRGVAGGWIPMIGAQLYFGCMSYLADESGPINPDDPTGLSGYRIVIKNADIEAFCRKLLG